MVNTLMLLLPCLLPSWEFFRTVEPSPRVQWRGISPTDAAPRDWMLFRPIPSHVTVGDMFTRLFWNPDRNEALYLISLSERVMLSPRPHSINEIARLLASTGFAGARAKLGGCGQFQFRLVFVRREGAELIEEVKYVSAPYPLQQALP